MYIKRHTILLLLAITLVPFATSSCKSDDEATEYSQNCYISSFTLGSLQRIIYGKTSKGMDSIYTTTYSGSYFPMIIDQRGDSIVNNDSLPVRTKVDRVLTTVSFSGTLIWRKADLTEATDTLWRTYSSTDSLDFTSPLHFRIYSDFGSYRTYTVKVNVHQQMGDSTTWDALGQVPALTATTDHKAIVWNGQLTILSKQTDGTLQLTQHPLSAGGSWTSSATTGTLNAIPATLQQQGGRMLVSTTDGNLLETTDGTKWTAAAYPTLTGMRLIAASDEYIYATSGGKLYRSNGAAWDEEVLDDEASLLPNYYLNSVRYTMDNGMERLMIIGSQGSYDKYATIWAKSWEKGQEAQEGWIYYEPNDADKFRCPVLRNLCIVPYDGGLQALGGRSLDGSIEPMDSVRHSADHGITWKGYTNNDLNIDPAIQTAAQTAQYITATADDEQHLWIIIDDKVWRGRINRLGWK